MVKVTETKDAPKAIGPYSQAVSSHGLLFISGQIGLDAETQKLISNTFKAQANQAFANVMAIAKAEGLDSHHAVKITIYLKDMREFSVLNEVMQHFFQKPFPARAAVQVSALPKDALIEIDAIFSFSEKSKLKD